MSKYQSAFSGYVKGGKYQSAFGGFSKVQSGDLQAANNTQNVTTNTIAITQTHQLTQAALSLQPTTNQRAITQTHALNSATITINPTFSTVTLPTATYAITNFEYIVL